MKPLACLSVAAWMTMAALPPQALAHIGTKLYPFFEVDEEDLNRIDLKDGSVADWENLIGDPAVTARDFFIHPNVGDGPSYDPADLDYRIWLAWHGKTGRIYVAAEFVDDVYINLYDGITGENYVNGSDYMSFRIDGDHSGGLFQPRREDFNSQREYEEVFQAGAQIYLSIAEAVDGRHANLYRSNKWFTSFPYVDSGGGVLRGEPTVSVIEFYVTPYDRMSWDSPDETEFSQLAPNKIIGFDIGVVDMDAGGRYHAGHSLSVAGRSFFNADFFVDGILLPKGAALPTDTAIQDLSWARIKASLAE